jgi:hypothetical protein
MDNVIEYLVSQDKSLKEPLVAKVLHDVIVRDPMNAVILISAVTVLENEHPSHPLYEDASRMLSDLIVGVKEAQSCLIDMLVNDERNEVTVGPDGEMILNIEDKLQVTL